MLGIERQHHRRAPQHGRAPSRRKSPAIADGGFQLTAARRSSVNLDLAGRAWAEAVVEEELALLCERVLERLIRLELRVEKSFEELSRTVHVDVARIVEERHRGPDRDAQVRRL